MSALKLGVMYGVIPFLAVMVGYQAIQLTSSEGNPPAIVDTLTPTPQVLKDLEQLGGFKENEAIDPKKTLYVFYDPTCPGCHTMFDASRKKLYEAHGVTMKWIPTTILGDEEESVAAAIYGLTATTEQQQTQIFSAQKPAAAITTEGMTSVATNNEYLKTYSALNASILAVPTVLYMNPEGKNVTVSYNISDDPYLIKLIDGI